jgi:hypothetical protein
MISWVGQSDDRGDGPGGLLEIESHLRRAGVPCAVIDTPTKRVVAANHEFADLLSSETPLPQNADFPSLFPPQTRTLVETILSGIDEGIIQFCQGQAQLELPAGAELSVSGWVRSLPGGLALVALVPAGGDPEGAAGAVGHPVTSGRDAFRLVLGALDHEWRFSEISADATAWFGWNPVEFRGTALQSVVHPEDAPLLLLALGRSGVDRRGVSTVVRVRSEPASSLNGSSEASSGHAKWVPVRCEVSPLCDHNPPRFAVAMWVLDTERDAESPEQRAARLEDHLWRIALEIAAAGIGDAPASGEMWWSDPALRELPTIARDLFLSQSTVRNHLSAIYRRLGVHSQAELLARLLPSRPPIVAGDEE